MQQLSTRVAANLLATLHVFTNRTRDDRGQAAAEYVGIIVFVAVMLALLFVFKTAVSNALGGVITAAIQKISDGLGAA